MYTAGAPFPIDDGKLAIPGPKGAPIEFPMRVGPMFFLPGEKVLKFGQTVSVDNEGNEIPPGDDEDDEVIGETLIPPRHEIWAVVPEAFDAFFAQMYGHKPAELTKDQLATIENTPAVCRTLHEGLVVDQIWPLGAALAILSDRLGLASAEQRQQQTAARPNNGAQATP